MKIYQKITALLLITLAVLTALFFLIIRPASKEIKNISQEIYSVRKDLEIKYQKGQSIRKTARDLKIIEPALPQLYSFYIKEGEELEFITTLEKLAQQHSLEQNIGLRFPDNKQANQIITVPLTLQLSGDYINSLKYFSALEQLDYYINVNNLAIRANDSVKGPEGSVITGNVNILLTGEVYWQTNP